MLRSPPTSALFPYTTLFRSSLVLIGLDIEENKVGGVIPGGKIQLLHQHILAKVKGADQQHTQSQREHQRGDRKSTRLNSSHVAISYAVFCLKKKTTTNSSKL